MIVLPTGHRRDLHIVRDLHVDAGDFTGGGWKWTWHTTESDWWTVDAMVRVLKDKRAAPHFVLGGRRGLEHPVAVQMVSLDQAARTLAHPSGPETNRANTIQVELCWRAGASNELREFHYRAMANLVHFTNEVLRNKHRRMVPRKLARSFQNTAKFSGQGYVNAEGHCGHMHVPGNNHTDPGTGFRGRLLMNRLADMPDRGFYQL